MRVEPYEEFFGRVCGVTDVFPFQVRFHELEGDLKVLHVPTGLGKTKTVIADWLYRRPTTRLIYCLPGRALTRQTTKVADDLVKAAGKEGEVKVKVLELMGGSQQLELTLGPHEPAILIGTQDILVSRALNRGYARSPFRWPIDFGLLNNDATWVFDEVQLLGEALATSTQLAAFRKSMGTFGKVSCVWMSATFERSWLDTVDFHEKPELITLDESDLESETVRKRFHAEKSLQETADCTTPRECAAFIRKEHSPKTLTIAIVNTVGRAQEIWEELRRSGVEGAILLHSRFRPCDREQIVHDALSRSDGVIVSTQVIEAGVDLDAQLMITDAAPWASLVQRFGRVNRRGERPGRIFWVRSPQRQKGKPKTDGTQYLPYSASEVERAIQALQTLRSASPTDLRGKVIQPAPYRFVLRRADLLDLFDTTPDLAGNQIDVSRFVRSGEETNVYVAWRAFGEKETPEKRKLSSDELCPVPHTPGSRSTDLKAHVREHGAWTWNYSGRGKWEKVNENRIYAGMRLLFRCSAGGYDKQLGWSPGSKTPVEEWKTLSDEPEESTDSDALSWSQPVTEELSRHTDEVVSALAQILDELPVQLNGTRFSLENAARYHDWGKAHPVFQQTLHKLPDLPTETPNSILAKQTRALSNPRHSRKWFRHELASALALIPRGDALCAYIVMAHHGRVRMNIRSMPGEVDLHKTKARVARGIQVGDQLFPADLGGGVREAETNLDLRPTELGFNEQCRAWSDIVIDLLRDYGPFRLAYLELLLRIADETASSRATEATWRKLS